MFLPFSGFGFFAISISTVAFIHLFKPLLARFIDYSFLLFFVTLSYLVLCLSFLDFLKITLFILYCYGFHLIFGYLRVNYLFQAILVACPMILFKLDLDPIFKIIGISYMTFRTIQSIVDANQTGRLSFIEFFTFLAFPPALLAGPIDRSYRFVGDLRDGYHNINSDNLLLGWHSLTLGFFFKFVIAYYIDLVLGFFDPNSLDLIHILSTAYGYTFYLFFDFSGYSLMAIGIAKMVGVSLPQNFDKPYLATNPKDFWRRFHISLGTWLNDYFFRPIYKALLSFKPLQGRRLFMQNIALLATFILMGTWNGFSVNYILSGFVFGIYSCVHNSYSHFSIKAGVDIFSIFPDYLSLFLRRVLMFNCAVFALYVFSGRYPSVF